MPVTANVAQLWLADPDRADITLTQARANSFGIGGLSFVTRTGIQVLLGQAAGIVISLLVAFSLVALLAAGTMLAAGAHAEVQRRLPGFGVRRALGFTPGRLAAGQAAETALLAAPAAALGLGAGALAVAGPSAALLAQLNEQPPGAALLPVLAACLVAITALVTAAATWPAWRAARRPPAEILRGGELRAPRRAAAAAPERPRRRARAAPPPARPAPSRAAPPRRRAARHRRPLRRRRARPVRRVGRDDRRLRRRRDADARARRAARAAARRPRHDRQALPADGAAQRRSSSTPSARSRAWPTRPSATRPRSPTRSGSASRCG